MTITATTTSASRSSSSSIAKDAAASHVHNDVDNYPSESKVGANAVVNKNVASTLWSNEWNAQHRRHDHLISSLKNAISTGPYRAGEWQ